jgi:hypothetical protein
MEDTTATMPAAATVLPLAATAQLEVTMPVAVTAVVATAVAATAVVVTVAAVMVAAPAATAVAVVATALELAAVVAMAALPGVLTCSLCFAVERSAAACVLKQLAPPACLLNDDDVV